MTDRELMQQVLELLNDINQCSLPPTGIPLPAEIDHVMEALRTRLAGWEKLNMHDHKEGDLGIGTVKWDASAPLVVHPHPAFQATQPDLAKVGEIGVWGHGENNAV